jgi:hypothetical protein
MAGKIAFAALVAAAWLATGGVSFADETVKLGPPEEFDFVQTANSGSFKDGVLTLDGIGKTMTYFGERPDRDVGEMPYDEFVKSWDAVKEGFAVDPPNASLVTHNGGQARIAILELREPALAGDTIRYHVKLLGGDLPDKIGPAALFIDPGFVAAALFKFHQHKQNPSN